MRLIRSYLLREILSLFTLSLVIITMLFMSQRIIQLTEWAINRGIGLRDMGMMMIYLLPAVFLIIIPIVTLFSILLAVGRLSSDNEIVALKSSGISLYRLFPPVLAMAALATMLALFTSQVLVPESIRASQTLRYNIVMTRTEAAVTPRIFLNLFAKSVFYVRDKRQSGKLVGVMAVDEIRPGDSAWESRRIVFARRGRFVHNPVELSNELWLSDGIMISEDRKTMRDDFVTFAALRMKIALDQMGSHRTRFNEQMQMLGFFGTRETIAGLERKGAVTGKDRKQLLKLKVQLHERLAFPLGCLALCFWAVPLGIQPPRSGRARSIVVAVLLSGLFYYLMILAKFAALYGHAPAGPALWAPDLLILVTGLYMLQQKNRERPILVLSRLEDTVYYLGDMIKEYRDKRRQR
jgi:lipopolysaccharide export system permease protein